MCSNRGLSLLSEQVAGKGFEQLGRGGVEEWIGRGGKREPETNRVALPFHLPTYTPSLFCLFWHFIEPKNDLPSFFPPFPS